MMDCSKKEEALDILQQEFLDSVKDKSYKLQILGEEFKR